MNLHPPSAQSVRVIPVMDIMGGAVVAGRGGRRDEYAPVTSAYLESPDPFHFVERFSSLFGLTTFYVADLDAIVGNGGNEAVITSLIKRTSCDFIVDGGYAHILDAPTMERFAPVFSTESFAGWDDDGDLSGAYISLDMKGASLVSATDGLTTQSALSRGRGKGCRRFIFLRLDAVGEKNFDSRFLISAVKGEEWFYGGGVSSDRDMARLRDAGYTGVFVSTALRDGTLCIEKQA